MLRKVIYLILVLFPLDHVLAQESQPFKIGLVVCLTGTCAETGNNTKNGAEMAANEINAQGGVLGKKVILEVQDSREAVSGAEAVSAFRNLNADPTIKYYIGPTWTPAGLSLAPIAAKMEDIIITSPTLGVADFNEAGDNIFNLWPHDDIGTRALANYVFQQGWKKVAVLSSEHPWCEAQGRTFAEEIKSKGGIITTLQEPLADASDVNTDALRIVRTQPDAVFISNYLMMGLGAVKLRSLNYRGPIITILMDRTQLEVSKGALEGALYASYAHATADFQEKYEKLFKQKPGIGSDGGYDAVNLYAKTIREAKVFDTAIVKKALLKQNYSGASGQIVFDEKGGVKKTPILYRVKGFDSELVGPLNYK